MLQGNHQSPETIPANYDQVEYDSNKNLRCSLNVLSSTPVLTGQKVL